MKDVFRVLTLCLLVIIGCEDTGLRMASEAGMDAIQAITLSGSEVERLAEKTAKRMDQKHKLAPPGNKYEKRLQSLTSKHPSAEGQTFEYKVYLSPKINAFALGDGSIRVYSGLMDMMNDAELRFVLGHEMGHVVKEHIKEKMELALASSAVRKGLASQQNIIGDLARSTLGSFMQTFLNARFSREEEKAADDYALQFMKRHGYNPEMAVSSLQKLGTLSKGQSFLSSHPAPEQRAKRLKKRLQSPGNASQKGWAEAVLEMLYSAYTWIKELLGDMLPLYNN